MRGLIAALAMGCATGGDTAEAPAPQGASWSEEVADCPSSGYAEFELPEMPGIYMVEVCDEVDNEWECVNADYRARNANIAVTCQVIGQARIRWLE